MQEYSSEPVSPDQLHLYIKELQDMVSAAPDRTQAMTMYHSRMQALCNGGNADFDYSCISAIQQGTAPMWGVPLDTDEDCHKQETTHQQQHALLCAALKRLQHMMPNMAPSVSDISSIFGSFGQLGVDPDALVPGVMDSLAQQFRLDIHAASGRSLAQLLKHACICSWILCKESWCRQSYSA